MEQEVLLNFILILVYGIVKWRAFEVQREKISWHTLTVLLSKGETRQRHSLVNFTVERLSGGFCGKLANKRSVSSSSFEHSSCICSDPNIIWLRKLVNPQQMLQLPRAERVQTFFLPSKVGKKKKKRNFQHVFLDFVLGFFFFFFVKKTIIVRRNQDLGKYASQLKPREKWNYMLTNFYHL